MIISNKRTNKIRYFYSQSQRSKFVNCMMTAMMTYLKREEKNEEEY